MLHPVLYPIAVIIRAAKGNQPQHLDLNAQRLEHVVPPQSDLVRSVRQEWCEELQRLVYAVRAFQLLLADVLAQRVEAALKALPVPKVMRWGDGDAQFVRPVHGLVMLHGDRLVPGRVLGIDSANITRGHRFMGKSEIALANAEEYETRLASEGKVIAEFAERRAQIERLLDVLTPLPFGMDEARTAARVRMQLEATGTPIGPFDLLIAATALARGGILVTRNTREFSRVQGLRLDDWFGG